MRATIGDGLHIARVLLADSRRAPRTASGPRRSACFAPVKAGNFASVTDRPEGELMWAIHGYTGHPVTALTLKLEPLVFVRPGELRGAEWSEFD
jgi:hypothetical protein